MVLTFYLESLMTILYMRYLVSESHWLRTSKHADAYAPALAVYEYSITFEREVETIWRRKWTAATALFLLTRYLLFAFLLVDWNSVTNADSSVCLLVFIPSDHNSHFSQRCAHIFIRLDCWLNLV